MENNNDNNEVTLSQLYIKTSGEFRKMLSKIVAQQSPLGWKDYAKKISESLNDLLYSISQNLSNEFFTVERCAIKFNSLYTETRVTIPFYGHSENDKKTWQSKQDELIGIILPSSSEGCEQPSEDSSLMYRNPEKPVHLLTELMWRFQDKSSDNNNLCLIINKDNTSQFSGIKHEDKDEDKDKRKRMLIESLDISKLDEIEQQINDLVKNPKIAIGKYDSDTINDLLRPVRLHFCTTTSNSLFYVADIVETDCMAGFEFEIKILNDSQKVKDNITELYSLIQKIRWYLSKYVVELINTVERIYVTHGDVYKKHFFRDDDAIERFIKELSTKTNVGSFDKISNIIKNHFKVANSEIGQYWTGYRHWSYEVARTVANVIDILFEIPKESSIEKIILKKGVNLEGLNKDLEENKNIPHIFQQLFRGLEREKELFLLSEYRDHFIHSFYVFVMGMIFLSTKSEKILPKSLIITDENVKCILKKWFIVAMCHDIAYVLEKGESILEKYVLNFMSKPKRKKNVLPWVPRLGNLMQVERLLDDLHIIAKENVIKLPDSYCNNENKKEKIEPRDIIIPIAFQHINHGIWSSLFVYHSLGDNVCNSLDLDTENDRLSICRAILPHHISGWKVSDFIGDFEKEYFIDTIKTTDDRKKQWDNDARIMPDENPLGYLLSLCDTLCQAGREAPELASDSFAPSTLDIKYGKILIKKKPFMISVEIYNSNENKDINATKLCDEHYLKPLRFLNLKESNRDNANFMIDIRTNHCEDTQNMKTLFLKLC